MTSPPPRSRRRALLLIVAILCSPLAAELLLRATGYQPEVVRTEVRRMVDVVRGDEAGALRTGAIASADPQPRVLQPYYGFDTTGGVKLFDRALELHDRPGRDEYFTVLVFGGSVAEVFSGYQRGGADHMVELLRGDPRLAGKRIKHMRFARAGFKQPQQLQLLAYFLSSGARPDVVINFDGLNEIKKSPRNPEYGVPANYPSATHWLHLTRGSSVSFDALDRLLETRALQRDVIDLGERTLGWGVYRSALLGRYYLRRMNTLHAAWGNCQNAYVESLSPITRVTLSEDERLDAMRAAADCWAQASILMNALCNDRGVQYLHALQPTLHDAGSKPISEQERELGVGPDGLNPAISEGYALLRERIPLLKAAGVHFLDLSMLFEDVEEPLYYDRAHLDRKGNELVAEELAAALLARL